MKILVMAVLACTVLVGCTDEQVARTDAVLAEVQEGAEATGQVATELAPVAEGVGLGPVAGGIVAGAAGLAGAAVAVRSLLKKLPRKGKSGTA